MNFSMSELPFPFRVRTASPLSDEELMRFSAANDGLRVERDATGELIVMSPTGTGGGGIEAEVGLELGIWARQDGRGKIFSPSAGFRLRDGSVRAADAAWMTWRTRSPRTNKSR